MVEDQQGAEVEVVVEEGGEEGVELSQATQLEDSRQIMELLADKQKPSNNLDLIANIERLLMISSMPSQLSLIPVLYFCFVSSLLVQSFRTISL